MVKYPPGFSYALKGEIQMPYRPKVPCKDREIAKRFVGELRETCKKLDTLYATLVKA